MPWEAWLTLGTIGLITFALVRNWAGPDTVLLAGLTLLMTAGLFSDGRLPGPQVAINGFGNEGLITIGVLFVVAAGLSQTGAMNLITRPILGQPRSIAGAQIRLLLPVAGLSAFLNNTPVVAMFMPVVSDWCKKTGLSPSKLFMPLSYAAILGGTCTLIGTSTNLVVFGMLRKAADAQEASPAVLAAAEGLGLFTVGAIGLPATVAGILYVLLASRKLLPDRRRKTLDDPQDTRRYTVEMLIEPGSAIEGRSIRDAGLRHLPGVYLAEIERQGERIVAVGPEQILRAHDRLIFVGVVGSVVDLRRIRGLVPATDQVFKLHEPGPNRRLVEVVLSDNCPLVGKSVREGRFRTMYNAVVIAVHRGDEHLKQKIGDIVLKPGDTLLLETHPRFVERHRNSRDFLLVSAVEDSTPIQHERAWVALLVMASLVLAVTFTPMGLLNGALLAAGVLVVTRCVSSYEARGSIEWRVLLAIGSAIGIGRALEMSGAAGALGELLVRVFTPLGPVGVLAGIYLLAMGFNMMIGHVGAAVLVFPIAQAVAAGAGLNFMPFVIAVMMAASADFANPISYPTHLMVYSSGGYRFSDYVRFGLPLNFIVMFVTISLAPLFWPL